MISGNVYVSIHVIHTLSLALSLCCATFSVRRISSFLLHSSPFVHQGLVDRDPIVAVMVA